MHTHAAERTKDGTSLWLLHITDNHLFTDLSEGRHGVSSFDAFQQVLASATAARKPDLVVDTGDIAHDRTREVYEMFMSTVREFVDCPLIATPGNHDLDEPFDQVLSRETVTMKGWQIVTVDTHIDDTVSGLVSQEELNRLEVELGANDSPTLVVGHHPAADIGCAWIDAHRIDNGDEFLTKLQTYRHVKGYLAGHVHQAFEGHVNGIRLMTTPSTCWQFKTDSDSFAVDDLRAGWRWLELRADGELDSHVERLVDA
ncbi:MAG: metallophosphoesterase [Gammaproteobacteria bacterium]|nr:metallophosphoesterase [Gammaproteobacteria bacterium]